MVTSGGNAKGKAAFEPPPWEREAFDALAAKRAAEDAARAAERARAGGPIQEPDESEERANPASAPDKTGENAAQTSSPSGRPAAKPLKPDDRVVEAMLIQLKGEERTDTRATKLVGWIASGITFVLGLSMLIAGLAIVRNGTGKSTAVLGSAVLSIFGLCFMGMAAWVWVSTSRSRGR